MPEEMIDIVERIKDAENATHALFNYIFQDAREEIERLRAAVRHEIDCVEAAKAEIDALRAKIEAMEKQEPAWFIDERGEPKRYHKSKADYCKYGGLDLLYALPGAQGEGK